MKLKILTLLCAAAPLFCCCETKEEQIMSEDKNTPVVVLLTTTYGDIKLKLDQEKAPITVENFISYVNEGHYNGTIFHRVIDGFMVQGGGFEKSLSQKNTKNAITNEAFNGLSNKRGTVAMARTSDVDSATSQFFINVVDNNFLDFKSKSPSEFGYCVFAEVIEGMPVVDKIKNVRTTTQGPYRDLPAEPIEITAARVVPG